MISKDIRNYNLGIKGLILGWFTGHAFYAVVLYRLGNWCVRKGIKLIPDVIKFKMLKKFACEISPYAKIGHGFKLHHTVGIVIGHQVKIGNNCEVFQNVTIGSNRKEVNNRTMPIIGNNVIIGSGAVIVGAINIGNNVKIGANTYVDKDIPDNVIVVGCKHKIIGR